MPSLLSNRFWNRFYKWQRDGDEWDDQARFCNQPYAIWKRSLAEDFILCNIDSGSTVMEIAPGHGRWTEFMVEKAKEIILVELNPKCINYCKKRFSEHDNIAYHVNDGRHLGFVDDGSVDFIWSYDSFVHMEKDIINSYFKEFGRIMSTGGKAIIHHAGKRHSKFQNKVFKRLGRIELAMYEFINIRNNKNGGNGRSHGPDWRGGNGGVFASRGNGGNGSNGCGGFRSDISRSMIKEIASRHDLQVRSQVQSWGADNKCNCKRFGDYISVIVKM